MKDIHKNIKERIPKKKRKILIVFDDMVFDILSNKKLNPIVTDSLIRNRKLKISIFSSTMLFWRAKIYYTKFYALFYYKYSKQRRTTAYCIKSFIRY